MYGTSASGSDGATDPNAALAPRPNERLAAMYAAGTIPDPDDVRPTVHDGMDGQDLFTRYASRVEGAAALLNDDEKSLLGSLYASTADKYGPESAQMKRIDELVRALAASRTAGLLDAGLSLRYRNWERPG